VAITMHIITQFGGAPSAPDFRLGSLVLPAVPWDSMGKSVAISWSLYKQEVGWLAAKHAAKTISKRAQNDLIMSEKYARRATVSARYMLRVSVSVANASTSPSPSPCPS